MIGEDRVVVRVFRSMAECAPWQQDINELNRRAARPCPFSTFEYMRDYVDYDEFHPQGLGQEFLFIALFQDERLVGFAPMARRTETVMGYDCPRMSFLMTRDNDRPHLVTAKEDLPRLAPVFLRYLIQEERDWDFLELLDQDAAGGLQAGLQECDVQGLYVRAYPGVPNSTLPLQWPSLPAYYTSLRRKFRKNIARNVRRLFASGRISWAWSDNATGTRELLTHYKGVEKRCWKSAVRGTISRHPMREAFFDALATPGHPLELKCSIVAFDGLPIAGFLLGAFDNNLYGMQLAFDERYAELGPGLLAIFLAVHKGIEGGYATLNLLHGSTHYKEKWLAQTLPTHHLQLFRRGSLPFLKAKLGVLKRVAAQAGHANEPADFNTAKRELLVEEGFVSNLDREPLRHAFMDQAFEHVQQYNAAQLARLLPFDVGELGEGAEHYRVAKQTRLRSQVRTTGVAIFDADAPPALAFARSLGRGRVPVHIYDARAVTVSGASRYVAGRHRCPHLNDAQRFMPWLAQQLERGSIGVIAPTSDVLTYYLAELYHLLPDEARCLVPNKRVTLSLLFKDRFAAACEALGVPTPWSWCPDSLDAVHARAAALPYPLIIKPKSHVGVGLSRGLVVHSSQELLANYRPYDIPAESQEIARQYPELVLPMLQEYVPGALQNLFSISGVLGADGTALAYAASKKREQWPPALGVGTVFEGYDNERCLSEGVRAAQALLGKGIFELEMIYDARTDRYLAIDLNPRAYGQIALDVSRGNDLPLIWYRATLGETVLPTLPPATKGSFIHAIPYHVSQWVGLATGKERLLRWENYRAMTQMQERVDIVNDKGDVLPSFVFAARMLRHPGGLVRPFLPKRLVQQNVGLPTSHAPIRDAASASSRINDVSDMGDAAALEQLSAQMPEAVLVKTPGGEA